MRSGWMSAPASVSTSSIPKRLDSPLAHFVPYHPVGLSDRSRRQKVANWQFSVPVVQESIVLERRNHDAAALVSIWDEFKEHYGWLDDDIRRRKFEVWQKATKFQFKTTLLKRLSEDQNRRISDWKTNVPYFDWEILDKNRRKFQVWQKASSPTFKTTLLKRRAESHLKFVSDLGSYLPYYDWLIHELRRRSFHVWQKASEPAFTVYSILSNINKHIGDFVDEKVHYRAVPVTGITFALINKTNAGSVTSGSATAYITKDGMDQSSTDNAPVHEGNGQWSLDLTKSEMDASVIGVVIIHSDAIPYSFTIGTH